MSFARTGVFHEFTSHAPQTERMIRVLGDMTPPGRTVSITKFPRALGVRRQAHLGAIFADE